MQKRLLISLLSIAYAFSIIIFFPVVSSAQEKFAIQKEGDVEVISNPKHPVPKDGSRKKLVFEEDLSIGAVEGDENYMFGELICFNTDEEGNFYVSDLEALRIQKYDPEGKFLLTMGRKGQGPGEFQSLSVVRFDQDGNLYVGDITSKKVIFFSKEGEFLKEIKMPGAYENIFINSKGQVVALKYERVPSENALVMNSIFELLDQDFTTSAELYRIKREIELPGKDTSSIIQIMANMINLMVFQPQQFLTLAPNDFIYFGYPNKYEISIFSPEGKLAKKITREYEPIPVRKKDRKYFEELISQNEAYKNAPEDYRKKLFQLIEYPEYKPAYQGFTLIQSGLSQSFTLMDNGWLALIVDSIKDEYTIFDLFDQEGRYIGNFQTDIPVEGLFFNNGKAYAISTEDGYKFVKRYRIEIQEY